MYDIKKEVKKKIERYSKDEYLDGYIKYEYLTEDGDADIFLNVGDLEDLYDEKSLGNQLDLNSDIYDFIDNKSSMLNNSIKINLQVVSPKLNAEECKRIKHLISEHYAIELYKIQKEYKKEKAKVIKLLLIGLFFFVCYMFMELSSSLNICEEVFGFLFSFSLWEALDNIVYTLRELRFERESVTQKLLMEISFRNKQ